MLHGVTANPELSRREWASGYRRYTELTRDGRRADLVGQFDTLLAELRRRIGGVFTVEELAGTYREAERWAYETLAAGAEAEGWSSSATVALDAAYHVYSRGARDYTP
jgi:hypothetical protein